MLFSFVIIGVGVIGGLFKFNLSVFDLYVSYIDCTEQLDSSLSNDPIEAMSRGLKCIAVVWFYLPIG